MLVNKKSILTIFIITIISILFIIIINEVVYDNKDVSRIIRSFENYSDKFLLIQKYAEETEGNLYADYSFGKFEIKNTGGSNEIIDEKVKQAAMFITKRLGFVSIYESKICIEFQKSYGSYPEGIIYLKDDDMPVFVLESVKLDVKWYYYMTKNV
jgi:hypothetical protein